MKGHTRKQISKILDMPERVIHYYTETKIVVPEIDEGHGRGTVRKYSKKNMVELGILKQLAGYGVAFKTVENIFSLLRCPIPSVEHEILKQLDDVARKKVENFYSLLRITAKDMYNDGIISQWENFTTDAYLLLYQIDDGIFKHEVSFGIPIEAALSKNRMDNSGSVLIINIGRIVALIKEH